MQTVQVEIENLLTIGARLKAFIESTGLSHNDFGLKCGIPKNSLSRILNNHNMPGSAVWQQIHRAFPDADVHYLVTGEVQKEGFGESRTALLKEPDTGYGTAKRRMKVYLAQAGDVLDMQDYDGFLELEVTEDYPTDEEFGRAAFLIEGDSMSPTVDAGWLVIAHRLLSFEEFENAAVYMVLAGGKLQCKRVYLDPDNPDIFILASDNPVFRDTTVLRKRAKLWRADQFIGSRNLGGE